MRIRLSGRRQRGSSPIAMIVGGIIGAIAMFAVAAEGKGTGSPRSLDPTGTWGPALMGVLLLLVAAFGVYLLVQQIRALSNLGQNPEFGTYHMPPGEIPRGHLPPLPPGTLPQYPPMPGQSPGGNKRAPWEQ